MKAIQLLIFKDYYYKQIENVVRPDIDPMTISLLFKNNEWNEGTYRYESDETRFVHSGVLEI
ncbi:hypothetical protein HYN48_13690 [Flavobacterium magnum]|uniref:Uncharacterized protein n=1 Tax=Flavobacterium magnum TaxID=2162713 RepID=A0A2S0RIU4_9FLAO|nr:hypothetical protein HYN48_13690 [Flavobacterium magnum]